MIAIGVCSHPDSNNINSYNSCLLNTSSQTKMAKGVTFTYFIFQKHKGRHVSFTMRAGYYEQRTDLSIKKLLKK